MSVILTFYTKTALLVVVVRILVSPHADRINRSDNADPVM